ncbi:MAG: hypothetical protein ACFHX7_16185 [Pseudomonadota bacterium]
MKQLFITMFVTSIFSAGAIASPPAERGYRTCEDAIMTEFRDAGVVANRDYYFVRKDDKFVYFLNGHVWNEAGERVAGRATCYTTANGRHLIEFKAEFGSYGKEGNHLVIR